MRRPFRGPFLKARDPGAEELGGGEAGLDRVDLAGAVHRTAAEMESRDAARVLVVDDEPELRQALRIRLAGQGYDVATAGDGVEAMRELRRAPADVVLLDLHIPAGTGFKICERIRATPALAATPVIAITADPTPRAEQRCFELGCAAFFLKPYDSRDLLVAIERAIGRREEDGPRRFPPPRDTKASGRAARPGGPRT